MSLDLQLDLFAGIDPDTQKPMPPRMTAARMAEIRGGQDEPDRCGVCLEVPEEHLALRSPRFGVCRPCCEALLDSSLRVGTVAQPPRGEGMWVLGGQFGRRLRRRSEEDVPARSCSFCHRIPLEGVDEQIRDGVPVVLCTSCRPALVNALPCWL